MSREIKFRVWDKILGKFIGIDAIQWDENNNIETIKRVGIAPGYSWTEPENIELMQFTGLLDKNGKEIYEGDIVRLEDDDGIFTTSVVYDPHGTPVGTVAGFYPAGLNKWEIIGNIYENPTLLPPSSEEKK